MTEPKDVRAMTLRAIFDADFRARLIADPDATLEAEGYVIPPDVLERLKELDRDSADTAADAVRQNFEAIEAAY